MSELAGASGAGLAADGVPELQPASASPTRRTTTLSLTRVTEASISSERGGQIFSARDGRLAGEALAHIRGGVATDGLPALEQGHAVSRSAREHDVRPVGLAYDSQQARRLLRRTDDRDLTHRREVEVSRLEEMPEGERVPRGEWEEEPQDADRQRLVLVVARQPGESQQPQRRGRIARGYRRVLEVLAPHRELRAVRGGREEAAVGWVGESLDHLVGHTHPLAVEAGRQAALINGDPGREEEGAVLQERVGMRH